MAKHGTASLKVFYARVFELLFMTLAAAILFTTIVSVGINLLTAEFPLGQDFLTHSMIKIVSNSIIALAVFELATVIRSEYSTHEEHDVSVMLQRTVPRFIATVCVAMALESLILIIKYSQLGQAEKLLYPVLIVVSSAILLVSLGTFLKMTQTNLTGGDAANIDPP
jgi:hypothetical protein